LAIFAILFTFFMRNDAYQGSENLGGCIWTRLPAYGKEMLPEAFRRKIEKLLNAQEMMSAGTAKEMD
jgi:hypothetical protein